jgi:hypothetical protein
VKRQCNLLSAFLLPSRVCYCSTIILSCTSPEHFKATDEFSLSHVCFSSCAIYHSISVCMLLFGHNFIPFLLFFHVFRKKSIKLHISQSVVSRKVYFKCIIIITVITITWRMWERNSYVNMWLTTKDEQFLKCNLTHNPVCACVSRNVMLHTEVRECMKWDF